MPVSTDMIAQDCRIAGISEMIVPVDDIPLIM